jgi:undecaprenyl diphosphate synthase
MLDKKDLIIPLHIGVIMDGNGRWAQARDLPRSAGHQAGIQSVREVIEVCANLGVRVLTLFVFSMENWRRPEEEVHYLMRLAEEYTIREMPELQCNGVKVQLMGKREGLPPSVLKALDMVIDQTQNNSKLVLNLALNYSGQEEILDAIKVIVSVYGMENLGGVELDEKRFSDFLYCPSCPDVDLVIRTGGEWRLSNFLLWRSVDAVFISMPVLWPDFRREHLQQAISIYTNQISEQHVTS